MAAQTSKTLRSRTRRPGLLVMRGKTGHGDQLVTVCPGLSDCKPESLHPGKPSVLVSKVTVRPPRNIFTLRPSQVELVNHPDSGQLVCLPEEVTRGRQGS